MAVRFLRWLTNGSVPRVPTQRGDAKKARERRISEILDRVDERDADLIERLSK